MFNTETRPRDTNEPFEYCQVNENAQQSDTQISVNMTQYQSLIQTVQTLSKQVSTLKASNIALMQSISTLTKTLNTKNLSQIVSKLNSVSLTLQCLSEPNTNKNQITSYFIANEPLSNQSVSPPNQPTTFIVTSPNIVTFIENEGLNIFTLKQHQPTITFEPMQSIRYKLQCICNVHHFYDCVYYK